MTEEGIHFVTDVEIGGDIIETVSKAHRHTHHTHTHTHTHIYI